jgi:DNA-binding transcriptional ArsR family regulator
MAQVDDIQEITKPRRRRLAATMGAVANETRIAALVALRGSILSSSALQVAVAHRSQSSFSGHMQVLRRADLVSGNRVGSTVMYELTESGKRLVAFLDTLE